MTHDHNYFLMSVTYKMCLYKHEYLVMILLKKSTRQAHKLRVMLHCPQMADWPLPTSFHAEFSENETFFCQYISMVIQISTVVMSLLRDDTWELYWSCDTPNKLEIRRWTIYKQDILHITHKTWKGIVNQSTEWIYTGKTYTYKILCQYICTRILLYSNSRGNVESMWLRMKLGIW
jgi:hypothetical protein